MSVKSEIGISINFDGSALPLSEVLSFWERKLLFLLSGCQYS